MKKSKAPPPTMIQSNRFDRFCGISDFEPMAISYSVSDFLKRCS